MTNPIQDLLSLPSLSRAVVVGGRKGLYNDVVDVIVMEAPDIEKWLKPGQLILTSLFSMKESSHQQYLDFVKKVKDRGASGIIIKTGRFVEEIPSGLIEGCDRYDIPLIQIFESDLYSEIILDIMQVLINQKAKMLDIYQNIHHEFKSLSMRNPKIIDVLKTLKKIINRDVQLRDANKKIIEDTHKEQIDYRVTDSRDVYREQYMHYHYERELLYDGKNYSSRLVCEIPSGEGKYRYLLIDESETFIAMIDYMAIENAASTLQYEWIRELALEKAKQSHINDLVDQIINGKYRNLEELHDHAFRLKISPEKNYRVVTWEHYPSKDNRNFTDYEKMITLSNRLVDDITSIWPRNVHRIFSNRLTFIVEDNLSTDEEFKEYVENTLNQIYERYAQKGLAFHVGISDRGQLSEVSKLAIQPLRVVQLSNLLRDDKFVMLYRDLGVYRILIETAKDNNLMNYVSDKLKILSQYDNDYLETLRVFLDSNQNYKQTSEILYIHPKTVRYRIEKIKEIAQIDFSNPDEILQLMLGMRIYQLYDGSNT